MSNFNGDTYLGEIRMFGGNYAPVNWAICDGQLLNIADYQALYNLIGNTYGGDGDTTFSLPDMRGRVPVHAGQGKGLSLYKLGDKKGEERVILTTDELPKHSHEMEVDTTGAEKANPKDCVIGIPDFNLYFTKPSTEKMVAMADTSLSKEGHSKPHSNIQPSLSINFIICINEINENTSQDEEVKSDETALMSQFIGEIRIFPYNFIPKGWLPCNGATLRLVEYEKLFCIIQTHFGGAGRVDFRLPNMKDRIPMHRKSIYYLGAIEGEDQAQINIDQMPSHAHTLMAVDEIADTKFCDQAFMLARANIPESRNLKVFCKANLSPTNLSDKCLAKIGGSKPHTNIQPSISLQYCIAYEGKWPSRQ